MRLMRSRSFHGSVRSADGGMNIAVGQVVDFDEPIGSHGALAEHLGHHAVHFEPLEQASPLAIPASNVNEEQE